jgi:transposase
VTWPAIEAHHEFIGEQLKAGVTVSTIHQRLRDERGLAVSVASLRRYVTANLPEETRRSQVKVLRPWPAEPGAEAQIDYGRLGRWLDPAAGKLVTVWAFVMVLACSRHLFVRPVIRLDQQGWSECHVAAFAFFGGVPARLVPDNLKTGVDRPDLYDPKINRAYAELAAHYGCLVDPARAYRPADKPQAAYCTSSGRFVGSSYSGWSGVSGRAADLGTVWRAGGVGRLVEVFAFVVIPLAADNPGAPPFLDGVVGDAVGSGGFGEGEQAGVAQPVAAAA